MADVLRATELQPLRYCIQKKRAIMAKTIADCSVLEEYRGDERLRGTPVHTTWCEQELTPSPEPVREGGEEAPFLGPF